MSKWKLYNVCRQYVSLIEAMEKTVDADRLAELEEQRVEWHNRLIHILQREGIPFRDREHVTALAFYIVQEQE